ncbi:hypothetical protein P3X46_018254 [Hevea brasiliensis]|uniref:Terpene synthase N-terminal domain-containing protein n=1 Tax=Hevea brasiliensis TaxID=3981 RepID=A0ABQ9LTZ2_HEVBR|nr:hypothetical protein P3X46_018254 [Hevea brasiliensis]
MLVLFYGNLQDEMHRDKAKKLEEEIRCMIENEDAESLNILEMIDDIQRLGLGHRFENDIQRILDEIQYLKQKGHCKSQKSLHATALTFRLLRQHGYEVSQAVFKDFMDHKGDILAKLEKDIKGILSLYEASHLAFEGEDLLQKAMVQTSIHLKNIYNKSESESLEIKESISHALELPLHQRMVMLEARWAIETYSKREDANFKLLELAKLDFNMVQSVLQRDLKDMSRWWDSLGISNKLEFCRDRLMECFFWTVGMVFEPEFSSCRKGLTKVTSFITTIDDVYDVYGTLEELELFTHAVERWDVSAVRDLPDYMKICFLAFFNTINEIAYHTLKEQGEDAIPYLKKAWSDLCKAFLKEAKWSYNKYIPSFEEYLENAWRSVSGTVILIHAYFLMFPSNSKEPLDCLYNYHDLLRWPSIIFRLSNDLGTSSAEIVRGETVNSISCYMNETGVSEEQAREHISKLIGKAWKKINEQKIDEKTPFAKPFVEAAINLARIAQCTYQHGDGHGAPDCRSKHRVLSLIIEPISINVHKWPNQ